ncbi:OmpW/AlkL family protein [Azospirillum halopraeferens]|uniref:OmpW/AlkL family protein n=1 Tax=Azospirillum halopraeferens TaxID=34010 RepID=UPI000410FAD2|nr:OmpW family protein [Azospirillum halopraeferens]
MSMLKRAATILLASTALAALTVPAIAQEFKGKSAGDILVRARVVGAIPQEKADINMSNGVRIGEGHVGNGWTPEVDFTYFFTDNIAAELIAGTTRHTVDASVPGLGDLDVGKVSLLPPTLTLQYHFLPKNRVSPYVGAGVNYTLFYNEDAAGGAILSTNYKNRFGWALQAGVDIEVADGWFVNMDVKKLFLKTKLDVTTALGAPANQLRSDVTLNPWLIGVGIGYRF